MHDGTILLKRFEVFDEWSRIKTDWTVIKGGKAKVFKFHHTIYSGKELKSLFLEAGFDEVKLFGEFISRLNLN